MVFANSKALFIGGVLTLALRPGVLGNDLIKDNTSSWIETARKLQATEFMEVCDEVFLSPDHMQQHSYLMSDFAEEVAVLCLKIAPNPDQGTCQTNDFKNLHSSLQEAFFRHASQHMSSKPMPIDMMMEWGNAGYIISNKTAIEQDVMRNDLCFEVRQAIGVDFLKHIPTSELPIQTPELPDAPGKQENDFDVIHVEKEEGEILSISAIIAISCAVAAAIALFFYFEARRRNRARINRMSRFNNGEDGMIKVNTSSGNRKFLPFKSRSSSLHPIQEIKDAIDEADWDSVYRLASQVAESDDDLSLPIFGSSKRNARSHLDVEDQERAKTLDDLAASADWTGLAVTAALYAGETSGSSPIAQADEYFTDESVVAGEDEDVEGQKSMKRMVSGLSKALNAGNWQQVTKFANLIKEEKSAGSSFDTDSQILSISSSSSSVSSDMSNTEMSKKQTIAKLMRAGKWKGVSIMANMYEMESKQHAQPSSSVRPYPPSPNHPYSDTRSILRTKELRHSDRVQENIVGFRRDP